MTLYKRVEIQDGESAESVSFVGVHPLRWRSEWGEPQAAFAELWPVDDAELAAIRERLEEITPWPWVWTGGTFKDDIIVSKEAGEPVYIGFMTPDGDLVVNAPSIIARLLSALEAERAEVAEIKAVTKSMLVARMREPGEAAQARRWAAAWKRAAKYFRQRAELAFAEHNLDLNELKAKEVEVERLRGERSEPGMPNGYQFKRVTCEHCGKEVSENWITRHLKSGCKAG